MPPEHEMRPLASVPPLPDGNSVVFSVGGREVRVEGDAALVLAVVGRCDGRSTVSRIAEQVGGEPEDVRGLIEGLAEQRVLVDATRAWQSFHRASANGRGFYAMPIEPEELTALMERRWRPPAVDRSVPLRPADTAVGEIAGRRSSGTAAEEPRGPSFDELSTLLAAMYSFGAGGHQTVPSAGAFYALTLHVIVRSGPEPLEPGLWWHDAYGGQLALVRGGEPDVERIFLHHPVTDAVFERGHPIVVVSADVERPSRKYSNRAYRFALMEAGAVMQNAYLVGTELGVPVRAIGGFLDEPLDEVVDMPEGCVSLLALLVGA